MKGRIVPEQAAPAAPLIHKPFAGANRHQRRARKHRAPTGVEQLGRSFAAAMRRQDDEQLRLPPAMADQLGMSISHDVQEVAAE